MKKVESFFFENYFFDKETKTAHLQYSFDGKELIEESFCFDFSISLYNEKALEKALQMLWITCGISYFKAFIPQKIKFRKKGITENQKQFFEKLYMLGLGEFFYQNNINPIGKINFESTEKTSEKPISLPQNKDSFVLVGGGKDSLTTIELLKENNKNFETLSIKTSNTYDLIFKGMLDKTSKKHLWITRKLDPKIRKWNEEGAYNGHVPISSILAISSICAAILTGKKNIILSNESSANEPNIVLDSGIKINHQYSKSLEFEKDFQDYLHKYISPDLEYFSFLRPLTELKIAEIFCEKAFPIYKNNFSSCNRNFILKNNKQVFKWCNECPKCAFVYLLFAPFLSRETLISIFGEDLIKKQNLQTTFKELLGQTGIKPFECVGEIQEVQTAVSLAQQKNDYKDFLKLGVFKNNYNWKSLREHSMPDEFYRLIPR